MNRRISTARASTPPPRPAPDRSWPDHPVLYDPTLPFTVREGRIGRMSTSKLLGTAVGAVLAGLLAVSIYSFGCARQRLFPDSTRPQLAVHDWLRQRTHGEQPPRNTDLPGLPTGIDGRSSVSRTVTLPRTGPWHARPAPRTLLARAIILCSASKSPRTMDPPNSFVLSATLRNQTRRPRARIGHSGIPVSTIWTRDATRRTHALVTGDRIRHALDRIHARLIDVLRRTVRGRDR